MTGELLSLRSFWFCIILKTVHLRKLLIISVCRVIITCMLHLGMTFIGIWYIVTATTLMHTSGPVTPRFEWLCLIDIWHLSFGSYIWYIAL